MTITSDADAHPSDTIMSTKELMNELVLGGGLTDNDQLTINGKDALEFLPRPEAYGNCRLALMAALDTMSPNSKMSLQIEDGHVQTIAAD